MQLQIQLVKKKRMKSRQKTKKFTLVVWPIMVCKPKINFGSCINKFTSPFMWLIRPMSKLFTERLRGRKKQRLKCHQNHRLTPYWALEQYNHFRVEVIQLLISTEAQNLQDISHMYELVNKSWLHNLSKNSKFFTLLIFLCMKNSCHRFPGPRILTIFM